eukprot:COSAG01_NODE_7094_length_3356_cov_5.747621_2_plen_629_part_01
MLLLPQVTAVISDIAGNAVTRHLFSVASRAVTIDLTPPTLPSVTIASDNGADTTRANAGDTITLTIVASEAIKTPTVTIAGKVATVSGSGTNYTAAYTVVAGNDQGIAGMSVAFADTAGNTGATATAVTDSSRVVIDLTAPTLATVRIQSNNAATASKVNVGDAITVSFVANEDITSPTVAIAGKSATVTSTNARTYVASYVVTAGQVSDGPASLSIAFRDLASNPGVTVTSVTDGSAVTIDLTAPTLTSVTMSSDNAGYPSRANVGDKITVVIQANEAIIGVSAMIAGQTATMSGSGTSYTAVYTIVSGVGGVSSDGLASLVIDFQDMASNAGAQQNSTTDGSGVTIDLTAPKLTTVTIVSNNAGGVVLANAGDTITLTVVADEAIVAPVVRIAGQSATVSGGGTSYTATYTVVSAHVQDGAVVPFSVTFVDLSGNVGASAQTAVTDGSAVMIDLAPPTLTSVLIRSGNAVSMSVVKAGGSISLLFTASEVIRMPTVMIAGQPAIVSGSGKSYTAAYTVVANKVVDGAASFRVDFTDIAGNVGSPVIAVTDSSSLIIDLTPPTLASVTMASSNPTSAAYANSGDTITVSITATEAIRLPTVAIATKTAAVIGSGSSYTATYVVDTATK